MRGWAVILIPPPINQGGLPASPTCLSPCAQPPWLFSLRFLILHPCILLIPVPGMLTCRTTSISGQPHSRTPHALHRSTLSYFTQSPQHYLKLFACKFINYFFNHLCFPGNWTLDYPRHCFPSTWSWSKGALHKYLRNK